MSHSATLQPDSTDVAVLRALMREQWFYPARAAIRESISNISKRLGMRESTVRERVHRLSESGYLKYWNLVLNPNVVGESMVQVILDVLPPSAKEDVMRKFTLIEGVWALVRYHENKLGVGLYTKDAESLKKKIELMTRIANSEHVEHGQFIYPPCNYVFKPSDIAILKSMFANPKKEYSTIARETHLSVKTVKRRIRLMGSGMALFAVPSVDVSVLKGVFPVDLFAFYSSPEAAKENEGKVLSIAGDRPYFGVTGGPEHTFLMLFLTRISEAEEMLAALRQLGGVKAAYLNWATEYNLISKAFKKQFDELANRVLSRSRQVATQH